MGISSADLTGINLDLARRVILAGMVHAPCLLDFDGEDKDYALAVLKGVAQEAGRRGGNSVASQGVGTARIAYFAASFFTEEDKLSLKVLCRKRCNGEPDQAGHPVGSFPPPDKAIMAIWPDLGGDGR